MILAAIALFFAFVCLLALLPHEHREVLPKRTDAGNIAFVCVACHRVTHCREEPHLVGKRARL
jgi:hypothetical protein